MTQSRGSSHPVQTPAQKPVLEIRPLTPERWPDLEAIFGARGCSVARGCWCMYYRESGAPPREPGQTLGASRKRAFKAVVDAGRMTGLVAYRAGAPAGWVSMGPREDYLKLEKSPVMRAVDPQPVWSIICFVVPAEQRGQGVAVALLQGAIEWARAHGVKLLEAYPVDRPGRSSDESMWFGAKSMYDAAGFEEVARRKPQRPVVRLRAV
jgi:GNAT superfamily N-acetyltransferase